MRDKEGSGFFYIEGLGEVREKIHLRGVVLTEDALKVSIFQAICEIKKQW